MIRYYPTGSDKNISPYPNIITNFCYFLLLKPLERHWNISIVVIVIYIQYKTIWAHHNIVTYYSSIGYMSINSNTAIVSYLYFSTACEPRLSLYIYILTTFLKNMSANESTYYSAYFPTRITAWKMSGKTIV